MSRTSCINYRGQVQNKMQELLLKSQEKSTKSIKYKISSAISLSRLAVMCVLCHLLSV